VRMHKPAFRCAIHGKSGIAASEFALIAPVMILIFLSACDLGVAIWRTMRLEMAARTGAQYAFANPQDSAGIISKVRGDLTGWTDITVAPATMICKCDDGTSADCTTGTCTVGGSTFAPIAYVSVTVTQPFQGISPLTTALFPSLATLRGNVEIRLH